MTESGITEYELRCLLDKINNSINGMCVAINGGKVLKHKQDTDLVRQVEDLRPSTICGFYNHALNIDWLREDLEYMGVKIT